MDSIVSEFKQAVEKTITYLQEELKSIRTGRASPSLVENLQVEPYAGQSKLRLLELATITTEGPSALSVVPFDPSTIQDIEKSILKSPLSLSPQVQGSRILINVPPLSQEQRNKFIKLASGMIEEKKNSIRFQRDNTRKKIKTLFEEKQLTEDLKFRLEKELDNITQEYMKKIQGMKEKKEMEIMEV